MKRRSIRAHLVRLVSAAAIPLLVFAVAVTAWNALATRKAMERGLQDTARALSLALEEQIAAWTGALNALATSSAIDADLASFRRQAMEVASHYGGWITMIDQEGRFVMTPAKGEGDALPHANTAYSQQVFRTGRPVISNLFTSALTDTPTLSVYVPVRREGVVRYALGIELAPQRLAELLARQKLPQTWLGVVTDGNHRIIARAKGAERYTGELAPQWYVDAVGISETGIVTGSSFQAVPVGLAFNRLSAGQWTVAVAVPQGEVASAWLRPVVALATIGLLVVALALGLSFVYARRIAEGVESLPSELPSRHPIREIEAVRVRLRAQAEERERRRMAEAAAASAEAANRSKDFFLSTLSHELRTPLSAIMGWIAVMRTRRGDPAKTEKALQVIERNALQQAKLIDDLLDVSRIISGKLKLERRPTDLSHAVSEAVDAQRPAANEKKLTLTASVIPGAWVSGDHVRLVQIAANLLTNAIKFTPAGGRIEVDLSIENGFAEFAVRDNGRGIEPALLPHLFDRFAQAEASMLEYQPGLGLGLAIVRNLAERHGGSVSAESEGPGKGATFRVQLPVLSTVESAEARAEIRGAPGADLAGLRILVVDDHEDARLWVSTLLSTHGATTAEASYAQEALDVQERFRADLLVSDIAMPRGDGFELIRGLRSNERRRMPAIALTALATDEDRERVLAAGYDAVIAKGSDPSVLLSTVARLASAVFAG